VHLHTTYTGQSKRFRTDHWYIYTGICRVAVFEKLLKIPCFGPSLIHPLWLLGSQQHAQRGVLLTSFSTWGTENSLAERNLESVVGDKTFVTFTVSKIGKHLQLCGRVLYRATRIYLESRNPLSETKEL
jgi:hypothetical protein